MSIQKSANNSKQLKFCITTNRFYGFKHSFTPTDVNVNNKKAGVLSLLLKKSEKGMGGERESLQWWVRYVQSGMSQQGVDKSRVVLSLAKTLRVPGQSPVSSLPLSVLQGDVSATIPTARRPRYTLYQNGYPTKGERMYCKAISQSDMFKKLHMTTKTEYIFSKRRAMNIQKICKE